MLPIRWSQPPCMNIDEKIVIQSGLTVEHADDAVVHRDL